MRYLRMACAGLALAALLAPAGAVAQTTTGTILGDVKDSTGYVSWTATRRWVSASANRP